MKFVPPSVSVSVSVFSFLFFHAVSKAGKEGIVLKPEQLQAVRHIYEGRGVFVAPNSIWQHLANPCARPLVKSTMSGQMCGAGTFILANDSDSESETEGPECDDAILATNSDLGWPEPDDETDRAQAGSSTHASSCSGVGSCWGIRGR